MKLLTPDQVAQILNCSKRHVLRMAENGVVDAIIISSPTAKKTMYRFTEQTIQNFIESQFVRVDPSKRELVHGLG